MSGIIEIKVDFSEIRVKSEQDEIKIDAIGVWSELDYVINSIGDNIVTSGGDYVIRG